MIAASEKIRTLLQQLNLFSFVSLFASSVSQYIFSIPKIYPQILKIVLKNDKIPQKYME